MTPIPKPTIQEAVESLSDRDEYKAILQFLRDERERLFADFRQCADSNDVMKVAGSVATLDEILQVLS
jgi:histidinol-phosphate/aromatic aminotransferase/cobyric acid decarboxylase-like protein